MVNRNLLLLLLLLCPIIYSQSSISANDSKFNAPGIYGKVISPTSALGLNIDLLVFITDPSVNNLYGETEVAEESNVISTYRVSNLPLNTDLLLLLYNKKIRKFVGVQQINLIEWREINIQLENKSIDAQNLNSELWFYEILKYGKEEEINQNLYQKITLLKLTGKWYDEKRNQTTTIAIGQPIITKKQEQIIGMVNNWKINVGDDNQIFLHAFNEKRSTWDVNRIEFKLDGTNQDYLMTIFRNDKVASIAKKIID